MATTLLERPEVARREAKFSEDAARALESDLKKRIEGEVRFDAGSRGLYATDASNYRQVPIGVVIPRTMEDVIATAGAARRHGAPILARGGGTSLAGQCCNVAVVIDFTKYLNKLLDLDPHRKRARVQPGIVLDWLRDAAEKHHLTFGPDPATHNHNTLGGMIGNNSCGIHSVMAGKTEENVEELEILTYDGHRMTVGTTSEEQLAAIIRSGGRRGEIYAGLKHIRDRYAGLIRRKYPNIPRRVSGYNLPQLLPENGFHVARALVGTECTCAITLGATVKLIDSPPGRSLLVLGYPDIYQSGDHVMEILSHHPIGLEAIDYRLVENMKKKELHPHDLSLLPEGRGWLLVEFGGENKKESDAQARRTMKALQKDRNVPTMKLYDDSDQEYMVWKIRESGLGATAWVPGQPVTWPGWEDSAVPPEKVGPYLRDLCKLYERYDYQGALYGHFGQGCIHTRITFDLITAGGIAKYRSFIEEATNLVVRYGGSLSGEHGDGQARAEFLPKMFGTELVEAFREFKALWDPESKMNPGKVVDPYRIDENLRLGTDFAPREPKTHFQFIDDQGSFTRATMRCVGVGECRRQDKGTMCPSYRATMEEEHSTRGRARLLFEMMRGEEIRDGWKSDAVFHALDLCLSCKGCKGDCPVNVDMATYKAEFLSHYYDGRMRPRPAYSMGWIHRWARIASHFPRLTNFITQTPPFSDWAKQAGGIAPERSIPTFATRTFKDWFAARGKKNADQPPVLLWADTFNNYFHPRVAQAATEVLEDAGFRVVVPRQPLCCGRPLYDYGFLDMAEGLLQEILIALKPMIEAGVPMVGLEPSCLAVFRDEMLNMLPHNEDARRLHGQSFTLAEFLERSHYQPPKLKRRAVVHGHCHQKAVIGMSAEKKIFEAMELEANILDDGCCGMAGSFGFEEEKYDVSMKVYEHELGPVMERLPKNELVLADGFSCKTQIEQATDRRPLHLAETIRMALREGPRGPKGDYPERGGIRSDTRLTWARNGAIAVGAAGLGWWLLRRFLR